MHAGLPSRHKPVLTLVADAALAIRPEDFHPFVPRGHVDD